MMDDFRIPVEPKLTPRHAVTIAEADKQISKDDGGMVTTSSSTHSKSQSMHYHDNYSHHQFHLPARGHGYVPGNRNSTASNAPAPELVADDPEYPEVPGDESPYQDVVDWDELLAGDEDTELTAAEDILDCYLDMPASRYGSPINQFQESFQPAVPQRDREQSPRPELNRQWPLSQHDGLSQHPHQHRKSQQNPHNAPDLQKKLPKKPDLGSPTESPRRHSIKPPTSYSLFPRPAVMHPRSSSLGQTQYNSTGHLPLPPRERLMDTPHYDANGNILVAPVRNRPANLNLNSSPAIVATSAPTPGTRPTTSSSAFPSTQPALQSAPPQKSVFEYDSDSPEEKEKDGKGLARIARALHLRSSSESHRTGVAAQQSRRARAATISAGDPVENPSPIANTPTNGIVVKKRHGNDMFGRLLGRK